MKFTVIAHAHTSFHPQFVSDNSNSLWLFMWLLVLTPLSTLTSGCMWLFLFTASHYANHFDACFASLGSMWYSWWAGKPLLINVFCLHHQKVCHHVTVAFLSNAFCSSSGSVICNNFQLTINLIMPSLCYRMCVCIRSTWSDYDHSHIPFHAGSM